MKEKETFKLNMIKLSHHHYFKDDAYDGMPIITSVQIDKKDDKYLKTVKHIYVDTSAFNNVNMSYYTEEIENGDDLFSIFEKYDLKNLKNNYFTDTDKERYQYYEIDYNDTFKIVGTYDNEIIEYKDFCDILNFKDIIKEEIRKIKEKQD